MEFFSLIQALALLALVYFLQLTVASVSLTQYIRMGLLLNPDEFLAAPNISQTPLTELEQLIIPKPIPDLRLYT
ncbi:MAG: hypothetical protein CL859_09785 [Cyanobium sp. ARS6]|nr:hypothetical protein [Cyanobium sp. ARS6]